MRRTGGQLRRMLDQAYLDWSWGYKNEAFRTINIIIKQMEGQHGKEAEQKERAAGASPRKTFQARRQELRDDFAKRFEQASAIWDGDPKHLF